jgi:hypothetical protein
MLKDKFVLAAIPSDDDMYLHGAVFFSPATRHTDISEYEMHACTT